jgi:hypothetical protein
MFFNRSRSRRPSLLRLLLALLGFGFSLKWCGHEGAPDREAYKAKRTLFRSKLRDAFRVWDEDDEPQQTGATEEPQA